jgi:hypothetical protein
MADTCSTPAETREVVVQLPSQARSIRTTLPAQGGPRRKSAKAGGPGTSRQARQRRGVSTRPSGVGVERASSSGCRRVAGAGGAEADPRSLLKAAEKRIESVEEMRTEAGFPATGQRPNDAARFMGIITMYEGMKPKEAATVFDRLEMSVLYDIASQIAPRKMSDILGLMQPEAAERLTVELARRAGGDKSASTAELPKIEGKMLQQKPN